jgi:hypothetical protein
MIDKVDITNDGERFKQDFNLTKITKIFRFGWMESYLRGGKDAY